MIITKHAQRLRQVGPADLLPLILVVLLAGCGTPVSSAQQPKAGVDAGYPQRFSNCGHEITVSKRPQRIVTIKSSATEAILALGAGDRLVGSAAADGPLPPTLATSNPPVLSTEVPSSEVVLNAAPDFIYAGWQSNLTAKTAGDRDRLGSLGIGTYVSPAACEDPRYRPTPLTFDDVFAEITEVGNLIDARGAAAKLIASQRTRLQAIPRPGADRTALWYSSGKTTPYVGAGSGAPQMIMSAIGLRNIAANVDNSWTSMSLEAIADANPDVIILVDATWSTAAAKIDLLSSNPVTADLPAVKARRFLTVDFAATQPGVRNVDAAAELADQLTQLGR